MARPLDTLNLILRGVMETLIDYTQKDFTQRGERYDLIFDAVGKTTASQCEHALALDGSFVTVQKGLARGGVEDLNLLRELIEAGELRSVIDRRYPLEQVAEAHRYVEAGQKQGNLIVTVGQPSTR